jgi:predicted AlkP superfamily phosphohydrolase/phosphomutase
MLIIGLDAATPTLVGRWMAEGKLPTFRRLAEEGAWGPLLSVPNTSSPAAWSTFMTGKNPGRHGIFFFSERVPGSYRHRFVNGSMRDGMAFWQLLGNAGRRVGIMNVPITFPAEPVNGFFIAGLDAPDAEHPGFAYPPTLMRKLRAELGEFVAAGSLSQAIGHDVLAGRMDVALRKLLERMETRTRWAEHLIETERPDLMTVVYTETDSVQHFFWKFMDPRHPDYTASLAERHGDAILRVYQKADEVTRRLIERFGDGTVLVVSDHGAGMGHDLREVVRQALRALGLFVFEGDGNGETGPSWRRRLMPTLRRWALSGLPLALRRSVHRRLPSVADAMKTALRGRVDWGKTRAYSAGSPGEIWLNVKGREPLGIVEPGAEYEDLRHSIAEAFRGSVDADTGEPLVSAVMTREQMYQGPYIERAPDLYVRLSERVVRRFRISGRHVALPGGRPDTPRSAMSGGHRPEGLVMLRGPGIRPGAILSGANLQDIAPTVLYALDAAVPDDLDGAVLRQAFVAEHLAARPLRYTRAKAAGARSARDFSEEEAAAVQRRLANLGYLTLLLTGAHEFLSRIVAWVG